MKPSKVARTSLAAATILGLWLGAAVNATADVVLAPNPNPVKNLINVPQGGDPNAVNSVAFENAGGIFVNSILFQGAPIKGVLTNSGNHAVLHSSGNLLVSDGGTIVNTLQASIVNDALFQVGIGGRLVNRDGGSIVNNDFFRSYGSIQGFAKAEFVNRGQVDLDGSFGGGLTVNLTGSSIVNTGSTAVLSAHDGAQVSNGGLLRNENGASLRVGSVLANGGDLVNSSARIENAGTVSNQASLTNANGAVLENFGQLLNASNAADRATLTNQTGSRIINNAFARIVNGVGGTFVNDVASEVSNYGAFVNDGQIQNTGGQFNVVDLSVFGDPPDPAAGVSGSGIFVQLAGALVFDHGTMAQARVDCFGGEISGTGPANGIRAINGQLRVFSGCTVAPGFSPGTLSVDGDLDFEGGTLAVQVAGLGAGLFDVLDVSGTAAFTGGTIDFSFDDGFVPKAGDRIPFLLADDLTGLDKLSFVVRGLPGGLDLHLAAGASGLELVVGATPPTDVPEPQSLALAIAAVLAWQAARRRRTMPYRQGVFAIDG